MPTLHSTGNESDSAQATAALGERKNCSWPEVLSFTLRVFICVAQNNKRKKKERKKKHQTSPHTPKVKFHKKRLFSGRNTNCGAQSLADQYGVARSNRCCTLTSSYATVPSLYRMNHSSIFIQTETCQCLWKNCFSIKFRAHCTFTPRYHYCWYSTDFLVHF